ncbi:MAG TPA: DUF1828 domain-containing protein [Bryobacteraceae bacterium]|nr:DUF1828 domain-containing protein [Bryobacteraceae bacterium]
MVEESLRRELGPLFACREEDGRVVIVTPLEYPDGDLMEFYLIQDAEGLVVTDLAETVATLAAYRFDVESTPKRRKLFEGVLQAQGVHWFRGELRLLVESEREIAPAVIRLSQAALRTTDLLFTARFGAGTTFKEDVEEYLVEHEIPYQADYKTTGRSGQTYTVDFYIERKRQPILMQTLSTGAPSYAEQLVSRAVRMWYDLRRINGRFAYTTLLDDCEKVWTKEHLEILESLSELVVWSERHRLLDLTGVEPKG